jgi:hypothetical protein
MLIVSYYCIDSGQSRPDETDRRFELGQPPLVGQKTWMHPNKHPAEWDVVETQILNGPTNTVCLAGVARGPITQRDEPDDYLHIFILAGQVYTWEVGWGEVGRPQTGKFQECAPVYRPPAGEFNPIPTKVLPVDKEVIGFEQMGSTKVYIVHLAWLPAPVAA